MGKFIDIKGQRFGFWVVLERADKNKNGQIRWLCQCECGGHKLVTTNSLRTGNSTSCGCNHTPNLVDQKFGKLTVIKQDESKNKGRRYWLCQCECNNFITVNTYQLRNGYVISCGCHIDPSKQHDHPSSCVCSRESATREDFPEPSSLYSPNHINLLHRHQPSFEKNQHNMKTKYYNDKYINSLIQTLL
jgi:hypothetical protein